MQKKLFAEFIGTAVLVLMGCGSAVFLGCTAPAEILAVAVAFGFSVVSMAYCIGSISGCHINPAITLGVWLCGRMPGKEAAGYIMAQVFGAVAGSAILSLLTSTGGFGATTVTGANGFDEGELVQALIAEAVFTFIFVFVVLGTTDSKLGAGNMAGLAIGLTLTLVHLVCIPITGTSVNPARSIGPALFAGGQAIAQLWVFIVAPCIGAILAVIGWRLIERKESR